MCTSETRDEKEVVDVYLRNMMKKRWLMCTSETRDEYELETHPQKHDEYELETHPQKHTGFLFD
jgi:hypothetical protein